MRLWKKCFYLRLKSSGWTFWMVYFHASNIFQLLGNCQVMNIYRSFTSFSCKINYEGFYGLKISFSVSPSCILLKRGVMANCNHNLQRPKSEFHLWNHQKRKWLKYESIFCHNIYINICILLLWLKKEAFILFLLSTFFN